MENLIEALSQLLGIVQLDGDFDQLDLAQRLWFHFFNHFSSNSKFQWDWMSKLTTSWAAEGKIELELLTDQCVINNSNWDNQFECFLGFDLSFNWKVHNMDWHSFNINLFVHTEENTLLPAPVGIILNFDFSEDDSAGETFKQIRLVNNQGSLLLVLVSTFASAFTVSETPLIFTLFAIFFHLLHELLDRILAFFIST